MSIEHGFSRRDVLAMSVAAVLSLGLAGHGRSASNSPQLASD
jgi:hypothetical protein